MHSKSGCTTLKTQSTNQCIPHAPCHPHRTLPSHTQQLPGFLLTLQLSDAGSRPVSIAPSQLYLCLGHPSQPPSI